MDVVAHASANFGERRGGARPDLIVLHYTAMVSTEAALARLCDPDREVSAHYLISADGVIFRLVAEDMRAWHAGAGAWGACNDINSASIGIELANDGNSPFAARQMDRLELLLADVMARWSIAPARVIGHSDIAPLRKSDPGPRFDWRRLATGGLAVWPAEIARQRPDSAKFCAAARRFGYSAADGLAPVLGAVRLRFRPHARGPLDGTDMAIIADLAQRHPVDQSRAST